MPEMVHESGGGIVYRSERELLDAIRLVDDPQKRDELGEKGHEAYLRSWTAERHLEKYFRLIESVRMGKRCLSGNSPY